MKSENGALPAYSVPPRHMPLGCIARTAGTKSMMQISSISPRHLYRHRGEIRPISGAVAERPEYSVDVAIAAGTRETSGRFLGRRLRRVSAA